MLKQRVITALVVVAVLLAALLLLSPTQFCLLIAAIVCYGAWEWSNLAGLHGLPTRLLYVCLFGLCLWGAALLLGFYEPSLDREPALQLVFGGVVWWLVALSLVATYPRTEGVWQPVLLRAVMGLLVLVPAWAAIVVLMKTGAGVQLLLAVIAIVALADIGAYFSGKAFGRHKLAANVSPGKTLEGLAGGLLANLIAALLLGVALGFQGAQYIWLIPLVVVTVLASVLGDLLESMLKRSRGIKDSGNILPGHGGMLDRVDGLTAALPVFVFALLLSGVNPAL